MLLLMLIINHVTMMSIKIFLLVQWFSNIKFLKVVETSIEPLQIVENNNVISKIKENVLKPIPAWQDLTMPYNGIFI